MRVRDADDVGGRGVLRECPRDRRRSCVRRRTTGTRPVGTTSGAAATRRPPIGLTGSLARHERDPGRAHDRRSGLRRAPAAQQGFPPVVRRLGDLARRRLVPVRRPGRPPAGSDRHRHRGGNHDLRPGGPGLPRDAVGGVAGRPPGPATAHDRLRPGAHGDLRVVPVGGSRQPVARLRAARDAVDLRGGVRPRLVGGAAQRRRPRGPADRQRAQRLAVGHDARGRRGGRWRRRHAVRSERSLRGRRGVVRGLRAAAARRAPSLFRAPRARRAHRDHRRPPAKPCATPDRIAVSGPSCR